MSKKAKPIPPYTGELLEIETPVKILKGLWTGATGTVKSVDAKTGQHRIFIEALDGVGIRRDFMRTFILTGLICGYNL